MDDNKALLIDLITNTYKQTVQDNADDFQRIYWLLAKFGSLLKLKGILTDEDLKFLMDLTNGPKPIDVIDIDQKAENKEAE